MGRLLVFVVLGGCWTGPPPKALPAASSRVARWHAPRQPAFGALYFDEASTMFVDDAVLDGIAEDLREASDREQFRVVGHADSNEPNPQLVSSLRARFVMRGLIARGVPATALDLHAVGSSDPADVSGTEWARARNRRVLIEPRAR